MLYLKGVAMQFYHSAFMQHMVFGIPIQDVQNQKSLYKPGHHGRYSDIRREIIFGTAGGEGQLHQGG